MECKADERNPRTGTEKIEHLGKGGSVTPLFQVCCVLSLPLHVAP